MIAGIKDITLTRRVRTRPSDKVGIGAAVNGLSPEHRDFLAAGAWGC